MFVCVCVLCEKTIIFPFIITRVPSEWVFVFFFFLFSLHFIVWLNRPRHSHTLFQFAKRHVGAFFSLFLSVMLCSGCVFCFALRFFFSASISMLAVSLIFLPFSLSWHSLVAQNFDTNNIYFGFWFVFSRLH